MLGVLEEQRTYLRPPKNGSGTMVSVQLIVAKRTVVTALALSLAMTLGAGGQVMAADLNPYAYKDRSHSPYNDPRYAELYGPDDRYDARRRHDTYRHKHAETRHRRYRDVPADGYDRYSEPRRDYVERDRPERYDDRYDRYDRPPARRWHRRYALAPHCVPRRVVMRRLFRDGWHDFHGLELRGPKAEVQARSEDGRLFALTIERCSGEIVAARQVEYRHTNGRYNDYEPSGYSEVPYRYRSYK